MEQGTLLQPQLPLHSEYTIASEHESFDNYSHPHPSSYTSGGAVEQLRRDGPLAQQPPAEVFANYASSSHHQQPARFVDYGVAGDSHSNQNAHNNFTDSNSGSISTSPSSAASSLAYTNYPTNHYTSIPAYSGPVQPVQSFLPSSYSGTRVSAIPDGPALSMLPPPTRYPTNSSIARPRERDPYATSTPQFSRAQVSPITQPSYSPFPETPRSVLSGTAGLSLTSPPGLVGYPPQMSASSGYASGQNAPPCANFPWPELEIVLELTCDGQPVTPEIHAKVEKGFFLSPMEQRWTCYRRNYFSVNTSFELHPAINNGRLYLKRNNTTEPVQAMGMRLSACVDTPSGKSIELIQHTPKRDGGPKNKPEVNRVSPSHPHGRADSTLSPRGMYGMSMPSYHVSGQSLGPYLPLHHQHDEAGGISASGSSLAPAFSYGAAGASHHPVPGPSTNHTFERIQFKQATANNGKRRAQQQFFHLMAELFVDVRKDDAVNPVWVKVAQRVSDKIVVRGRSPSHYNDSAAQSGATGRSGSASGGAGYTTAGASYGGLNAGGFRSSTSGYGSTLGGSGAYRSHYSQHCSPDNSGSSPESMDDGADTEASVMDTPMSEVERAGFQGYEGYQYYPSTIYEGSHASNQLPPLAKVEGGPRYTTEPRQYVAKTEYSTSPANVGWSSANCGRFQGVESSRGYFPAMSTSYS